LCVCDLSHDQCLVQHFAPGRPVRRLSKKCQMGCSSSIDLELLGIVECRLCNSLDVGQSLDLARLVPFRHLLACHFSSSRECALCAYAHYHNGAALSIQAVRFPHYLRPTGDG